MRVEKVKRLQALMVLPKRKIYKDFDVPAGYTEVCEESANRLFMGATQDIIVIILSMIIITAIPMYKQTIKREHMPLLPYFLPFIDPDTDFGFYINHVNHLIFGLVGYSAFLGYELVIQMLKNTTWAQTSVISYNLKNLELANEKSSVKEVELQWRVREIMAEITDSDNFLVEFADIYYWKVGMLFCTFE